MTYWNEGSAVVWRTGNGSYRFFKLEGGRYPKYREDWIDYFNEFSPLTILTFTYEDYHLFKVALKEHNVIFTDIGKKGINAYYIMINPETNKDLITGFGETIKYLRLFKFKTVYSVKRHKIIM